MLVLSERSKDEVVGIENASDLGGLRIRRMKVKATSTCMDEVLGGVR